MIINTINKRTKERDEIKTNYSMIDMDKNILFWRKFDAYFGDYEIINLHDFDVYIEDETIIRGLSKMESKNEH
jgi:hypothetical protein